MLTEELIDFVAQSQKFQPHFHFPLQSGSDAILAAMRRRYRTDSIQERMELFVERMPQAAIGIDVIVGFPGEGEAEFAKTVSFLRGLPAAYFHVFTYSERAKTTALSIEDVVPVPVRKARNKVLQSNEPEKAVGPCGHVSKGQRPTCAAGVRGRRCTACELGYTPEYVRVGEWTERLCAGSIVPVQLGDMSEGLVQGLWLESP